jgi:general stress protein YciG
MARGPEVAYFLAEFYLPAASPGGTAEALARARAAAEEVAREGDLLRLLRIIFVPGDETCFVAYEAASSEAVAEAGRRAGLDFERIVAAVEAK